MNKILLIALTALPIISFANSDNGGFYVGGSAYLTRVTVSDNDGYGLLDSNHTNAASVDAFVGYQFGRYFAIEGGPTGAYSFNTDSGFAGGYLALKGIIPISQKWNLYGKGGISYSEGWPSILLAAGASYHLNQNWSVGPEFSYIRSADMGFLGDSMYMSMMRIGVSTQYTF